MTSKLQGQHFAAVSRDSSPNAAPNSGKDEVFCDLRRRGHVTYSRSLVKTDVTLTFGFLRDTKSRGLLRLFDNEVTHKMTQAAGNL